MQKLLMTGAVLLASVASAAPMMHARLSRTDLTFLPQAAMGNTFEIKAAQIAETKRAGRADHAFAGRMIRDHSSLGAGVAAAVHRIDPAMRLPGGVSAAQQRLLDGLQGASGRRFEALYRADMIQSHAQTYALFQRYTTSRYGSPGIQRVIRGALPTVKMHWDMAGRLPRM